jgi:chromosome segregation ATPase
MLRQLSQEKADLEAKLAAAEKELAEKKKLSEDKSKEAEGLQNALKQKEPVLTALQSNNDVLKTNNDRYRGKLGTVIQQLRDSKKDNILLVNAVKERTQWIEQCTQKNKEFVTIYGKVLEEYQEPDFLENLKTLEPLTGITKVAKENQAQDYRYKLSDLKITPWVEPVSGPIEKATQAAPQEQPEQDVPEEE